MSQEKSINNPIFIVGMNGSGTTMMLDHLNSHPEIFGFRIETLILPYYISRLPRYGDLNDDDNLLKLWNDLRSEFPFQHVNRAEPVPLPEDWKSRPRDLAAIFDYMMSYFAAKDGKRRWCEKTPMYVQHMPAIAEVFPGGHFIHMIRDGRDCARSFHRRWGFNPQCTMMRWKSAVRGARRDARQLEGKYLEVRYERLTADPEAIMQHVCEFLDISFDQATLETSRMRAHMTGSTEQRIVVNTGSYHDYFNEKTLWRLERIAGSTLAELGYSTTQPQSDEDLPRLWFVILMFVDRFKHAFYVVRKHPWGRVRSPWRRLWGRFLNGLRQVRTNKF